MKKPIEVGLIQLTMLTSGFRIPQSEPPIHGPTYFPHFDLGHRGKIFQHLATCVTSKDALLLTSVVDFPGNDLSFQRVLHLVARADHKWLLLEVKLAEKLVGVLNVDRPLCDDSIFQICRVLQDIVISARHESQSPTDTAALLLAAVLQYVFYCNISPQAFLTVPDPPMRRRWFSTYCEGTHLL